MKELSILIPTFNDECTTLVRGLLDQCNSVFGGKSAVGDSPFEIIVADDGSTDKSVTAANSAIAILPHCRYIPRERNSGRAAIRNFLAREASYSNLLFIDSDMTIIRNDFINKYMASAYGTDVIYGGYDVPRQEAFADNLRYRYERSCRHDHTAEKRRLAPYSDFHTSNFMIPRTVMLAHPLDEQFRHYGYEDVAFGEELKAAGVAISHIDNPMGFCRFESNAGFISKTEEGLRTLAEFRMRLESYSRLLAVVSKLDRWHITPLVSIILKSLLPTIRRQLSGSNPSLSLFKLYKLGYLITLLHP